MNQVFSTNPTAQRFFEEAQKPKTKKLDEIKDYRGDNWKLEKNMVRGPEHPHYSKPYKGKDTISSVEHGFGVWHNTRTGEVHEGNMLFRPDGTASPHHPSYDGSPTAGNYYHISHYKKAKGK